MPRTATARMVLALLGVFILLANPAGICAGTMGATNSGSHPCCPKPSAEKAPCVCIDRQPAAPTVPPLVDQPQLEIVPVAPLSEIAAAAPESIDKPEVALAADALLLSIHQLLL